MTIQGESPVRGRGDRLILHLSKTRHVEVSPNLRGPSRKAKYSLATDSEPSSASERWEEPLEGEVTEPETTRLQAVGARLAQGKLEIRNPKSETNPKHKNRNPKRFWILPFAFGACFGFRDSDFEF